MSNPTPQPSAWQPIDSAPNDGTYVVVWPRIFSGVESCARRDEDQYALNPRPFWRRMECNITSSRSNPPTHWKPVSKGPST